MRIIILLAFSVYCFSKLPAQATIAIGPSANIRGQYLYGVLKQNSNFYILYKNNISNAKSNFMYAHFSGLKPVKSSDSLENTTMSRFFENRYSVMSTGSSILVLKRKKIIAEKKNRIQTQYDINTLTIDSTLHTDSVKACIHLTEDKRYSKYTFFKYYNSQIYSFNYSRKKKYKITTLHVNQWDIHGKLLQSYAADLPGRKFGTHITASPLSPDALGLSVLYDVGPVPAAFQRMLLVQWKKDQLKSLKTSLPGRSYVSAQVISSTEIKIICGGITGEYMPAFFTQIFVPHATDSTLVEVSHHFEPLKNDQYIKSEKGNQKNIPLHFKYISQAFSTSDGSGDAYFVVERIYTNALGIAYFGNLWVYKVKSTGETNLVTIIPKAQVNSISNNTKASYLAFEKKGILHIIYNDTPDNFAPAIASGVEAPINTPGLNAHLGVLMVSLLPDGTINRQVLVSPVELPKTGGSLHTAAGIIARDQHGIYVPFIENESTNAASIRLGYIKVVN